LKFAARTIVAFAALAGFAAQAADLTGNWSATITTAAGTLDYTYAFRQNGGRLIGTLRSRDGVVAITNGYVNHNTVTFTENVTVKGRRAVHEYSGELVSDNEIKFVRRVEGSESPAVEFVAIRSTAP
jgi:hypothetical protein